MPTTVPYRPMNGAVAPMVASTHRRGAHVEHGALASAVDHGDDAAVAGTTCAFEAGQHDVGQGRLGAFAGGASLGHCPAGQAAGDRVGERACPLEELPQDGQAFEGDGHGEHRHGRDEPDLLDGAPQGVVHHEGSDLRSGRIVTRRYITRKLSRGTPISSPFSNIAAYKFVALSDITERRARLREVGRRLELKGTVLLGPEGINIVASGQAAAVDQLIAELREDAALSDLRVKVSPGHGHSFSRWLVKLKREIIAFGDPSVAPARYTSSRVTPAELRAWLDEGRAVHLLDVRNDYEVAEGTFHGARAIGLAHFRDFPAAIDTLPDDMKDALVVTFCTGGIRCEKAAPLLEARGFKHVVQLDGGILQYFEDVGAAHYQGDCFVFDRRVAVTPSLEPAGKTLCFACQEVLTDAELADERYVEGMSCPRCHEPGGPSEPATLRAREAACLRAATPLPGSLPYTNLRPVRVLGRHDGLTALALLQAVSPDRDWERALFEGLITRQGEALDHEDVVRAGQRLVHEQPEHTEPDVNAHVGWLHEDRELVVVDKSAPLPVHPSGSFNRNTLLYLLERVYQDERLRPAHRLDAATSGVQVLARTAAAARFVQEQFACATVGKTYVARVHGHPAADSFTCEAPISRGPVAGIRRVEAGGLKARTDGHVLRRLADGSTLVRVHPRTGRTNQIRLHLWHLGWPIVGDPVYLPGGELATDAKQTGPVTMCLHAHALELVHPGTRQPVRFEAPAPAWAEEGKP